MNIIGAVAGVALTAFTTAAAGDNMPTMDNVKEQDGMTLDADAGNPASSASSPTAVEYGIADLGGFIKELEATENTVPPSPAGM